MNYLHCNNFKIFATVYILNVFKCLKVISKFFFRAPKFLHTYVNRMAFVND